MAVEISGGEGSLFWQAGIDDSNLDQALERIADKIQASVQKQLQAQEQASASQKQLAQDILKSAGAIDSLDRGFSVQVQNMTRFGAQVGKVSQAVAEGVDVIEKQIAALNSETIELKAKGIDIAPLTAALDKLQAEVDKIKQGKIELTAGKVDISALTNALHAVQSEYDKLSAKKLKLDVDTSGLRNIPPVFSQASVDAFRQVKPLITETIANYKALQASAVESLSAVEKGISSLKGSVGELSLKGIETTALTSSLGEAQKELDAFKRQSLSLKPSEIDTAPLLKSLARVKAEVASLSGETLKLKVEGIDIESAKSAFEQLQTRFDRLKNTALLLKVKGVDTSTLTTAIDRAKAEFESLRGLTLHGSADLDISGFQKQYNTLQQRLAELESEKIALKVEGADATKLERDIKSLRTEAAAFSREALKLKVDSGNLPALEKQLAEIKRQAHDLDFEGFDADPLLQSLGKVESQIEKIRSKPLDLQTGTVNIGPLTSALLRLAEEKDELSRKPLEIIVKEIGAAVTENRLARLQQQAYTLNETIVRPKIEAADISGTEKALASLKREMDSFKNAAIELKIKTVDPVALTASFDKVEARIKSFGELRIAPTFDATSFEREYAEIKSDIDRLQATKIVLAAAGIDTTAFDKTIAKLQAELDGLRTNTLNIRASIDTTSVQKSLRDLNEDFARVQNAAIELSVKGVDTKSLTEAFRNIEAQAARLKDISIDLNTVDFEREYSRLKTELAALENEAIRIKADGRDVTVLEKALDGLKTKIASLEKGEVKVKATLDASQLDGEVKEVKAELNIPPVEVPVKTGSLKEKIAELESLKKKFEELSAIERNSAAGRSLAQSIHNLDRDIANVNNKFQQTNNLAKQASVAIGSYLTLQAGTTFLRDVVKVRGEFQQLQVALNTFLGTKERADALMAEITQLAATTPFTLQEVGQGAKQLLAFGSDASTVVDTLRRLGDVAAGVGAPINDLIYLYGTLQTQGRAYTRDIIQFAQRGIPIYDELAKVLGKPKEELDELLEAGKVGFPQVQQAFENMTNQGGKFFDLMKGQSKTLTGQLSNLQDAWSRMLNDIGKNNEGIFSGAISVATELVNNYKEVIKALEALVVGTIAYKAALGAEIALQRIAKTEAIATAIAEKAVTSEKLAAAVAQKGITSAIALQAGAANVTRGAMQALNATMTANPALAVAAAVGALVYAYTQLSDGLVQAKSKAELLGETQRQVSDELTKAQAQIAPYVEMLKQANLTDQQRLDIYEKLKQINPEIVKGLDAQSISVQRLRENIEGYLQTLRSNSEKQGTETALSESLKQEAAINKILAVQQAEVARLKQAIADIDPDSFGAGQAYEQLSRELLRVQGNVETLTASLSEQHGTSKSLTQDLLLLAQSTGDYAKATQLQVQALEQQLSTMDKASAKYGELVDQVNSLKDALEAVSQADLILPDAGNIAGQKSNRQLIDEKKSIKELDDFRKNLNDEYQTETDVQRRSRLAADLRYADARKKVLDPYSGFKESYKQQQSAENATNKLLEQRKSLLEEIANLQRDAKQATLPASLSAVDEISQKYDKALQKIKDFNEKIARINAQKGTNVQGIGQVEINKVLSAKSTAINAELQKQEADAFKANIEEQKKIYDAFESYKLQVGVTKANDLFLAQTQGFATYIDKLEAELNALTLDDTPGGISKKQFLTSEIQKASQEQREKAFQQEIKNYTDLFNAAATYDQKRTAIDEKYGRLHQALNQQITTLTEKEYDEQNKALLDARNKEIEILNDSVVKQTSIYQKLGESTIAFSKQQLQQRIADLQKVINTGLFKGKKVDLTPDLINAIQQAIQQAQGIIDSSDEATDHLAKLVREGLKVSQAFDGLATSLSGVNDDLAAMFKSVGGIVAGLANAAAAYKNFNTVRNLPAGDPKGGLLNTLVAGAGLVGTAVSVVSGIANAIGGLFSAGKRSREEAARQMAEFQANALAGEISITEQYRERERSLVRQNKTRLEGIQAERALLEDQKKAAAQQYQDLLNRIQAETFIVGQTTEKYGGVLGIGRKTRVKDITASLAGQSFEDLEKLNAEGKLSAKAKELFDLLKKAHDEGQSIEDLLQQNKEQAAEIFTGTTADSLVDTIAQGFAQGKRSAADFAGTFQELMQNALVQSLKLRVLEGPLQELFDQFADETQSGDQLTASEIAELQKKYNAIIENAGKQFDQLQQIAGVSLSGSANASNSFAGAIKGVTEETANLIAGQFGGMRLTMIDVLNISMQSLKVQQQIESNTASAVIELAKHTRFWNDVTTGAKKVSVQ